MHSFHDNDSLTVRSHTPVHVLIAYLHLRLDQNGPGIFYYEHPWPVLRSNNMKDISLSSFKPELKVSIFVAVCISFKKKPMSVWCLLLLLHREWLLWWSCWLNVEEADLCVCVCVLQTFCVMNPAYCILLTVQCGLCGCVQWDLFKNFALS